MLFHYIYNLEETDHLSAIRVMTKLENRRNHFDQHSSAVVNDLDLTPRGRRERCDCACIPKPPKFTPIFGRFSFGYTKEVTSHTTATSKPSVSLETDHCPVHGKSEFGAWPDFGIHARSHLAVSFTQSFIRRLLVEIVLDRQELQHGEIKLDGTSLPELYDSSEDGDENSDLGAPLNSENRQFGGKMPLHQQFIMQFLQMLISIVLWHKWKGIHSSNTKLLAAAAHNNNSAVNPEAKEDVSYEAATKD